jgi:LysM repeat protein
MNKYRVIGIILLIAVAIGMFFLSKSATAPIAISNSNLSVARSKNAAISLYVVRNGDTLVSIAALFGVSPNAILWANHLSKNSTLQVGQTLVISPVTGVQYTVKSGDRLESIAQHFGGSAADIGTFNGVDDSSLTVGSEIIIPDSVPSSH